MSKLLRTVAVLLFLLATLAFATTTDNGSYGDSSGPVPLCRPGMDCQP